MDTRNNYLSELRKIFWPIEWHENKKFLPMAAMMFFILLNYSMLRSIKDGFVVKAIGPEAISFTKMYLVFPCAILAMIVYAKLCNILSREGVFYSVTMFFVGYLAIFAFLIYPNPTFFHPDPNTIESLAAAYPNVKWFIRIAGKWSFVLFYIMAELWGSIMLTLLFWQFANQTTKTIEAKRFYSMYGMLGNFGLIATGAIGTYFLSETTNIVSKNLRFVPLFMIAILGCVAIMYLYNWINRNVLTDPNLYDPSSGASAKKKKVKLSLSDSFKMIITSKYLGLVALLVLSYGISISLVEGVWKAKIGQLYDTAESYTRFMMQFQSYQGVAAIIFMLIGSNILRKLSWKASALFTPLMMLATGIAFFSFILFDSTIGMYLSGILTFQPLAAAVMIGTVQNVLAKATKYSLFDSTKEMSYIPLDDEMKTKGKAAVDVIGGRFGKSGGGFIISTFFILFHDLSFTEATPYFASVFFLIVILWVFTVFALSNQYQQKLAEQEGNN